MCCSPHPCLVMSKRVPFLMKKWQNSGGKYLIKGVGTEQAGTLMGNQSGNECSKVGHVATNNLAESICEAGLQIMEKTGV